MSETNKPPKDINEVLQRYGWDEVRRQIDHNRYTYEEFLQAHPDIASKLADNDRADRQQKDSDWSKRVEPRQTAGPDGIGYVTAADVEPEGEPWPEPYRVSSFDDVPVEERDWLWNRIFPAQQPGILASEGANGKTTLLMQLGAAVAANTGTFLGRKLMGGPALLVLVEDDDKELRRRMEAIRIDMGLPSFKQLDEFHILNLCGRTATLWRGGPHGGPVVATPGWSKIRQWVKAIRPKLLGLDPKANLFLGQELDRGQATAVINDYCRALAMEFDLTDVICEHPSQSGVASRTGNFGSGGWVNSSRGRAYFERIKNADGEEEDQDLRTLTSNKANYAAKDAMTLRWHMTLKDRGKETGVFRLEGSATINPEDQATRIDGIFVELLQKLHGRGEDVSPTKNSSSYFVTLMKRREEARGVANEDLVKAKERLMDADRIKLETVGKGTRAKKRLVPK